MKNSIPVQRPSLNQDEVYAVKEVFKSGWLGLGSKVKEFEKEIGTFIGTDYVIGVNSGTSALHLALDAIGISKNDEVLVPSLTFVATAQAITQTGAKPVFCDISEETLNIDLQEIAKRITSRTRAIMVVHYRGAACDMKEILEIAKHYSLRVIEDAAHAFGSSYKGKKIGGFGDITAFSFDPIKNITCGEGGAIIVNDKLLYKRLLAKRQLGIDKDSWSRYRNKRSWQYDVREIGYRYHLSNINAAIGLSQLNKCESFIKKKNTIAKRYDEEFKNISGLRIIKTDYKETALFMYVIRVLKKREKFIGFLRLKGIETGIHYLPVHTLSLYKNQNISLPITETISKQIVTLPLYSSMTKQEVERVIEGVKEYFSI